MTTQKETLASWLKDAHAMKSARIENLQRQTERCSEFPQVQRKLEEHVTHSRQQMAELENCLQRVGADPSSLKEMTSKVASKLQGWTTATAPDEVVKYAIADEAFAEFEAASFDSLAAAAAECGEQQIAEVCARMRDEERRMAEWFRGQIPQITRQYLSAHAA
jgi:ferritin-like metal-binding protein YciE